MIHSKLKSRELGQSSRRTILSWDAKTLANLTPETLHGHTGCVNRMALSDDATLLASGGDDTMVLLWDLGKPLRGQVPRGLHTEHTSNIFGVDFLTQDSRQLVSGAMDKTCQHHVLRETSSASQRRPNDSVRRPRHDAPAVDMLEASTTTYRCFRGRVKHVKTLPSSGHVFLGASECGTVRQFDVRMDQQGGPHDVHNVVVGLKGRRGWTEVKALDVSATRPHLLALACGDSYVRVYDRRKLDMRSLQAVDSATSPCPPLMALAPPHMQLAAYLRDARTTVHSTFVNFNQRGDQVVATFSSDHAYIFDIRTSGGSGQPLGVREEGEEAGPSGRVRVDLGGRADEAEARRLEGNRAFGERKFSAAVRHYEASLKLSPAASPVTLTNLSAALLMRGWHGDALEALRHAETAVSMDQGHFLAHVRRVQALRKLEQWFSVRVALDQVYRRFPAEEVESRKAEFTRWEEEVARELEAMRNRLAARRDAARQRAEDAEEGERVGGSVGASSAARTVVHPEPTGPISESDGEGTEEEGNMEEEGLHSEDEISVEEFEESDHDSLDDVMMGAHDHADPILPHEISDLEGLRRQEGIEEEDGARVLPPATFHQLHEERVAGARAAPRISTADPPEDLDALMHSQSEGGARVAHMSGHQSEPSTSSRGTGPPLRDQDVNWRYLYETEGGRRTRARLIGHCNQETDIKECRFVNDKYVCCGSDDGRVFVYEASSGRVVAAWRADDDVCNCVLPHPLHPLLITSGIEDVIRVWSPSAASASSQLQNAASADDDDEMVTSPRGMGERPRSPGEESAEEDKWDRIVAANQERSSSGPVFRGIRARLLDLAARELFGTLESRRGQGDGQGDEPGPGERVVQCRTQ